MVRKPESTSVTGAREPSETVVVMGGGIAGLGIALALRDSGQRVVIVERDPEPPEIDPATAFEAWKRPGVFQFRHPHIFLGRIHRMLNERYPELLAQLKAAGFWQIPVSEYGTFRDNYQPAAVDAELTQLCGRRATFEYVLQRYVRSLPHVQVLHGASVTGLQLQREGQQLRITGVDVKRASGPERVTGDVFIDCMGRRSPAFGWLREQHGSGAHEQVLQAETLSFSRHYRLREGEQGQLREQSGDMDFLRYAIVYGEQGNFAVSLSVAESDSELVQLIKRGDGFERVCREIAPIRDWIDRAEATTPVIGVGDVRNRWIDWAGGDRPVVLGLLHAGDSARETNPFYGRGCSAAFVDAHLVADALLASREPEQRARKFAASVRAQLRPYFELAVRADEMFNARSRAARGQPITLLNRFFAHVYITYAVPAAFEDQWVARSLLGIQHMRPPYTVLDGVKLFSRMFLLAVTRIWRPRKPLPLTVPPPRSQITALSGTAPALPGGAVVTAPAPRGGASVSQK